MKSIIQDMKHNYFINAVIMVILGIVLVIWPHILGVMLCYLLGGALIVMGVFQLISFLRGERLGFYNKFVMMMGIVLVLLGIWICAQPRIVLSIIPVVVGIIVLIHGLMDIQYTLDIKKAGSEKWWIALIAAALTLIVGLLLMLNPFTAYEITMVLLGVAMLYDGGSDLALLLFSYLAQRDTDKRLREFKGNE
ncbi:MAG: hypothetical protein HFH79_05020 [Lachnospiraceae bacterium]|jgi:uncharacterized membrane protein HdeD (DUF308 family)|nr:hypothetical protein [Lachnospiraceae bacterium]MCI8972938.1 hypothetical protein [Lachnospiraceae bacterium]